MPRFPTLAPVLALLAALALAPAVGAQPAPPPAVAEPLTADALRADFQELYARLQRAHIDLYAFTPKADLDRAFAETLAGLDRPMTRGEAETRFQLFLARARMGHTRIEASTQAWETFRLAGGKAFPLSLRAAGGKVWVADVAGPSPARRGDELVSLEGQPIAAWLDRTGRHVSAETGYMRDSLLEYWFPRLLWQEVGPRDRYRAVVRRDGRRIALVLEGASREEARAFAASQPLLLDLDTPMRQARMLPGAIAYLRPGPFYNAEATSEAQMFDARAFTGFIDAAFDGFLTAGASDLIVDLRGNPGGDNAFSDPMIAWFADRPFRFFSSFKVKVSPEAIAANQARIDHDPVTAGEVSRLYARLYSAARPGDVVDFPLAMAQPRAGRRFTGRVWLLIDRQSYSNAVNVAALVQDYRFGTLMGEPTADMASAFGAMERFELSRSGIVLGFPKAHIVRPAGDARPRGVTPDIVLPSPVVATPDDPVLRAAIARVEAARR